MVLQAWLAAHGRQHDVVVGVARADGEMKAHAWVDFGKESTDSSFYAEIHRIAP
jgi:hypothetical protein